MSRKSKRIILGILIIVVIGMTTIFLLAERKTPLPDYGITTEKFGTIANSEAQRNFVKAYLQGNSGQWQKVIYTIEGDPIIYTVRYNNQPVSLEVSIDTRKDKFGSKRLDTYVCQKMIMVDELRLQGCIGASSGEIVVP